MPRHIITLTTDFGQADGYVGTMKGVILGICPEVTLVDITHEVRPQAVRQAAYLLSTAVPYFPPDTVHLVVVDPGVGSERRAIAVQTGRAIYVAPDNGVLDLALAGDPARRAVNLTAPGIRLPSVSATFHGRDVFAPAAAHLACGTDLADTGEAIPVASLVTQPSFQPQPRPDGSLLGQILHVDHFGNLVTSFRAPLAIDPPAVLVGRERIARMSRTFSDVGAGEFVAYVGSSGYLEIAVREGDAARRLGVDLGDPVAIERAS
jgi:S-adenosylmethionine hydrolase